MVSIGIRTRDGDRTQRTRACTIGTKRPTYLSVECTRCLQFQQVVLLGFLVDGNLGVQFLAEALAGTDQHIHGVHFVLFELALFVFLLLGDGRVLDDGLLAVDLELLQLVAEHALDRFAFELGGNLLHGIRHRVVAGSVLHQSQGGLAGVVSREDNVRRTALRLVLQLGTDHDRVGGHRNETVDVRSQVTETNRSILLIYSVNRSKYVTLLDGRGSSAKRPYIFRRYRIKSVIYSIGQNIYNFFDFLYKMIDITYTLQ